MHSMHDIYVVYLRNLTDYYDFDRLEEARGKMCLVLDEVLYNLRMDRSNGHAVRDVLRSSDLKASLRIRQIW